jgi:hypothetical protein
LTAHGAAAVAGIAGGLAVVALAVRMTRLRPAPAVICLVLAVLPFAALTWWSIVTPLLAVLTITLGAGAARDARTPSGPQSPQSPQSPPELVAPSAALHRGS